MSLHYILNRDDVCKLADSNSSTGEVLYGRLYEPDEVEGIEICPVPLVNWPLVRHRVHRLAYIELLAASHPCSKNTRHEVVGDAISHLANNVIVCRTDNANVSPTNKIDVLDLMRWLVMPVNGFSLN